MHQNAIDTNQTQTALCTHFGECGGCMAQDVAYEDQRRRKAEALASLLSPYWQQPIHVHPSPVIWYYRNKVDFNIAEKRYDEPPPKDFVREIVIGFRKQGKWFWPLDMTECRIASPDMGELLDAVREWARGSGLRPFNTRAKKGFLKMLLVREGKRTGERMVCLVTRPGECDIDGFRDAVLNACDAASVQWITDESFAPAMNVAEKHVLHGAPVIHERLEIEGAGSFTFRISPESFFQTNTLATEVLYGRIRAWAARQDAHTLYDLYGGSGGIAFSCANLFDRVISVEEVAAATADGVHNANVNDIGNVEFKTAPVEVFLRDEEIEPESAVIVDPARAGMHPKAIKRIIASDIDRFLYVSCKPGRFVEETDALSEVFAVTSVEAVDLFPHTPHVEAIIELERKRPAAL